MSTRLIIEGNAVYEIDEDCCGSSETYNTRKIGLTEQENSQESRESETEEN